MIMPWVLRALMMRSMLMPIFVFLKTGPRLGCSSSGERAAAASVFCRDDVGSFSLCVLKKIHNKTKTNQNKTIRVVDCG